MGFSVSQRFPTGLVGLGSRVGSERRRREWNRDLDLGLGLGFFPVSELGLLGSRRRGGGDRSGKGLRFWEGWGRPVASIDSASIEQQTPLLFKRRMY